MRTKGNPVKLDPKLAAYKTHRVIIPVYIPNQEGYYRDAFRIFQLSLNSLIKTTRREAVNITIINNGCIPEVDEFIMEKFGLGEVDQYVLNLVNRGKADAIVGAAKASYEPFITFADADVMFLGGWIEQVELAFSAFGNAGVICPFPAPHLKFYFTSSTWLANLFRIRYRSIVSNQTLDLFERNLGISNFFKEIDRQKQFYLKNRGVTALVGAGHFVATYRRDIFKRMKYEATQLGLKGGLKAIEREVDRMGLFRLSLPRNYVLHMGNVFENWMVEVPNHYLDDNRRNLEVISRSNWRMVPYSLRTLFCKALTYLFHLAVRIRLIG